MQENQEDWLKYNEPEAINFIRGYLPKEKSKKISDDEIDDIIDMVYDYYEAKGILDNVNDEEEEVEIDIDDLLSYIYARPERKSYSNLSDEDIESIVQGELNYCDSLTGQDE